MRKLRTKCRMVPVALALSIVLAAATAPQAAAHDFGDHDSDVLQPNQTMTGIYVMGGTVAADVRTVGFIDAQINFARRVLNQGAYKVEIIQKGQATTTNCPGLRRAASGYLCIYEVYKDSRLTLGGVYNPIGSGGQIDQDGAVLYGQVESANSDDGDSPFSTGGWAITGLKSKHNK